jgi:hypothetical protein
MWGLAEQKRSRFARDFDLGDIHDQLDTLRGYVQELSRSVGQSTGRSYERTRDLAAALLLALGLGVAIGYFICRGRQ